MLADYANWLKIGERIANQPVSYFAQESTRGQYAGWLRTKAYYEVRIAQQMELESQDECFEVKVENKNYII